MFQTVSNTTFQKNKNPKKFKRFQKKNFSKRFQKSFKMFSKRFQKCLKSVQNVSKKFSIKIPPKIQKLPKQNQNVFLKNRLGAATLTEKSTDTSPTTITFAMFNTWVRSWQGIKIQKVGHSNSEGLQNLSLPFPYFLVVPPQGLH